MYYAYNALGERTTTALAHGEVADPATRDIDYTSDRVTVSETAPAARGATTVLRTTTRVWKDDDTSDPEDDPDAGTLVSSSDSNPATGQSWSWSAATPDHESTTSTAPVATAALNFCDYWPDPKISDAPADGIANWTDSWLVPQGNFFQNGTNAALTDGGPIRISWLSSNTWAAGDESNNEQALYREYLDDY